MLKTLCQVNVCNVNAFNRQQKGEWTDTRTTKWLTQARLTDRADERGEGRSQGTEWMTTGLETYASGWQHNKWHNAHAGAAESGERDWQIKERENHLHHIPMMQKLLQGGSEHTEGWECGGGQQAIFICVLQGLQHLRGETWSTGSWERCFINIKHAVGTCITECDVWCVCVRTC